MICKHVYMILLESTSAVKTNEHLFFILSHHLLFQQTPASVYNQIQNTSKVGNYDFHPWEKKGICTDNQSKDGAPTPCPHIKREMSAEHLETCWGKAIKLMPRGLLRTNISLYRVDVSGWMKTRGWNERAHSSCGVGLTSKPTSLFFKIWGVRSLRKEASKVFNGKKLVFPSTKIKI